MREKADVMETNKSSLSHMLYLDILRVIACFSVVLIHVSAPFAVSSINTLDFWMGNIIDSIARVGVPVFVMISGSLFLDENKSYSYKKISRHILKMIIFFLVWSLFYCAYSAATKIMQNEPMDLWKLVLSFLKGHYHLWFVPMIIGLYLIVPLLKLWVNQGNKKYVEYFLVLSILFTFVLPYIIDIFVKIYPQAQQLEDVIDSVYMYYPMGFSSYFILGWYLNNFEIKKKKQLFTAGLAGLFITISGTYLMPVIFDVKYNFYGDFTVNVLIYSIAVFVAIKELYKNKTYCDCISHRLIKFVCSNSLAIYAMHVLIVDLSYRFITIHTIIKMPLMFIMSTALPIVAALCIRKIPILKNYLV